MLSKSATAISERQRCSCLPTFCLVAMLGESKNENEKLQSGAQVSFRFFGLTDGFPALSERARASTRGVRCARIARAEFP